MGLRLHAFWLRVGLLDRNRHRDRLFESTTVSTRGFKETDTGEASCQVRRQRPQPQARSLH